MQEDDSIKKIVHNKWIARCVVKDHQIDLTTLQFASVDLPSPDDVLLGKGKPIQQFSGNTKLRLMVQDHLDEYHATKKKNKDTVVLKVLEALKARRGRFLVRDRHGWRHETHEDEAKEKISKTFLWTRSKLKREQQQEKSIAPRLVPPSVGEGDASLFFPHVKREKCVTFLVGCWH